MSAADLDTNQHPRREPAEDRSAASRTCVSSSPYCLLWVGFRPPYTQTRTSVDAGIMYSQSFTVKPADWVTTFQVSTYLAAVKGFWWGRSSFGPTASDTRPALLNLKTCDAGSGCTMATRRTIFSAVPTARTGFPPQRINSETQMATAQASLTVRCEGLLSDGKVPSLNLLGDPGCRHSRPHCRLGRPAPVHTGSELT